MSERYDYNLYLTKSKLKTTKFNKSSGLIHFYMGSESNESVEYLLLNLIITHVN